MIIRKNPALNCIKEKSKRTTTALPIELLKRIKKQTQATTISCSDYIRLSIIQKLKEDEKK